MRAMIFALVSLPLLTACDGAQPFTFGANGVDETEDTIDLQDPNVDVNSKFLYDPNSGMVMNSVAYDAENDELVINNLPFDGPTGRYDHRRVLASGSITSDLYDNIDRRTSTEAQVRHYAVYVRSEHLEATAALGNWANFGYGGANLTRDGFDLPQDGEYVFVGTYAGLRSFSDRGGIEIITGDVRILLDVNDFDPFEGIQGAITGTIFNRDVTTPDGSVREGLPSVDLAVVEFSTADGTFVDGSATTFFPDGSPRDTGSFEGLLAGPDSAELGAHILIEGTANFQQVRYQSVTYEIPQDDIVIPGIPGVTADQVIEVAPIVGQYDALNSDNLEFYQTQVDNGIPVPLIGYNAADLPEGAQVIEVEIETQDISSDFNAQEVGVLASAAIEP